MYGAEWVAVVPSYSEVVGMVNLEAALFGCPTITTVNTGIYDWWKGDGVVIGSKVSTLKESLEASTKWSKTERKERGIASFKLVHDKYAWAVILKQWQELYQNF